MSYHSDDESTMAGESPTTFKKEALHLFESIKNVRTLKTWKTSSVVAIIRERCVPVLQVKCRNYQKSRWGHQKKLPILVTSDNQLRTVADKMAKYSKYSQTWVIAVSGLIPEISFHINTTTDKLYIVRVNMIYPKETLNVFGSSTWNGRRLAEWQKEPHQRHLRCSQGVKILLNGFGSGSWSTTPPGSFSEEDRSKIWRYLQETLHQMKSGSWWDRIKEPIAGLIAILDLAVGTFKAWTVLDCSAKGIFISLKCGPVAIKAGGFSVKLLAALKVAAPPVAVAAVAAGLI